MIRLTNFRKPYIFFDDHTDLLDGAVKLVKVDLSFVVNVKEFEGFGEELLLVHGAWALLNDLCLHFVLKTKVWVKEKVDTLE